LPTHKLGSANGLIGVGLAMGPAVGTFAGGLLMAKFGWRPVFMLLGLVSALWLIPWLQVTRTASRMTAPDPETAAPSFLAILRRREAWGASLGHFAHNYSLYFVITWLPLYLVKARGLTVTEMAELAGLIYLIYALSVELSGLVADRRMRASASGTRVRKSFCIAGHSGVTLCMIICAAGSAYASIAALLASGIFFGFNSANIFAIGQTLGGPRGAGKWTGVQNCFGNMAGILAPIITGFVVDRTGEFTWAFAIASGIGLAGIIGWGVIIPRIEPLDWGRAR
jgi:cyanate permease